MITLTHFKQAHTFRKQDIIPFRLLQLQAFTLLSIIPDHPYQDLKDTLEVTPAVTDWLAEQPVLNLQYSDCLGGDVYICEFETDLLHIKAYDPAWTTTHDGAWPNVTDTPLVFDVCEYIAEASGACHWVLFVSITNNAGGDSFYVPSYLWHEAIVAEHFALSEAQ